MITDVTSAAHGSASPGLGRTALAVVDEFGYRQVMFAGGGPSGLMYVLRSTAMEEERGDSPDLSAIYAPGTQRQARRRLIAVWVLSAAWIPGLVAGGLVASAALVATLLGLVLALSTQFEAAWIGSPIRPWTLYSIPVALTGFVVVAVAV